MGHARGRLGAELLESLESDGFRFPVSGFRKSEVGSRKSEVGCRCPDASLRVWEPALPAKLQEARLAPMRRSGVGLSRRRETHLLQKHLRFDQPPLEPSRFISPIRRIGRRVSLPVLRNSLYFSSWASVRTAAWSRCAVR